MQQAMVVLYSTRTCPYSWEVREFLREQRVAFVELDVDDSESAAQEVQAKLGDMVVPLTVVSHPEQGETVIVGYDRQRLGRALELL